MLTRLALRECADHGCLWGSIKSESSQLQLPHVIAITVVLGGSLGPFWRPTGAARIQRLLVGSWEYRNMVCRALNTKPVS